MTYYIGETSTVSIIEYECAQSGIATTFTYTVNAVENPPGSSTASWITKSGSNISLQKSDGTGIVGKTFTVTVTATEVDNPALTASLSF